MRRPTLRELVFLIGSLFVIGLLLQSSQGSEEDDIGQEDFTGSEKGLNLQQKLRGHNLGLFPWQHKISKPWRFPKANDGVRKSQLVFLDDGPFPSTEIKVHTPGALLLCSPQADTNINENRMDDVREFVSIQWYNLYSGRRAPESPGS